MSEPSEIRAGDAFTWTKTLSDYPASTHTLEYILFNADKRIVITTSASGDDFEIDVDSATSAAYAAGEYEWVAQASIGGERYTADSGRITILPDLLVATDGRTFAQISLDNIEAVMQKRASLDQESYTINGRSLARTPFMELTKLRDYFRNEVQNEQDKIDAKDGKPSRKRITTRF